MSGEPPRYLPVYAPYGCGGGHDYVRRVVVGLQPVYLPPELPQHRPRLTAVVIVAHPVHASIPGAEELPGVVVHYQDRLVHCDQPAGVEELPDVPGVDHGLSEHQAAVQRVVAQLGGLVHDAVERVGLPRPGPP